MPTTYRITDQATGKVYRVTGDGTKEEALAEFMASRGQEAPTAPAQQVAPAEEPSFLGDLAQGAKASIDSSALGLKGLLPQSVQNAGDWLDRKLGFGGLTKETAVQAPDSAGGMVGKIGTDVLTAAAPGAGFAKLANAVNRVRQLKGTAAAATGLGINAAGNAGAAAALAPEDRGTAALLGAGGEVVGAAGSKILGGAFRNAVSPEAKLLLDQGIYLTPGQALTGPDAGFIARTLRNTEDKLSSMTGVGDVISNAQNRSIRSFNNSKINEALSVIGKKTSHSGLKGIEIADDLISKEYDRLLPNINLDPGKGKVALFDATQEFKQIPLFEDYHAAKIDKFITNFIDPVLAKGTLDGRAFKKLDSQLGEYGRKFGAKGGSVEGPLGEAFIVLRDNLRKQLDGATPEATKDLNKVNEAFAKLVPVVKAGDMRSSGLFTPLQLSNQIERAGGTADEVISAARQVLPSGVPDTGTAGREFINRLLTPTGLGAGTAYAASGVAGLAPLMYAGAGLAGLYTKTGLRGLTDGVHPMVKALRAKISKGPYDPNMTEEVLQNLIGRSSTAMVNQE